MIEARNVFLKRASLEILDNFNWTLPDPGIYLLLGRVGSGKTALASLFSGRLKPAKGQVLVDGQPVYQQWGGSGQQVFLAQAEQEVPFDETIAQYIYHEIQVAGGNSNLMKPYWPILEASLAKGKSALVSSLSHGQRLLMQMALAAALPNRLCILDGHLTYLDRKTTTTGLKMLQESLKAQDRFILLTAGRIVSEFPSLDHVYILDGGMPIKVRHLPREATVDTDVSSHSSTGAARVFPFGEWGLQQTMVSGQHFSVLARLENGLRIKVIGSIDQALAELNEKGYPVWRFEWEKTEN